MAQPSREGIFAASDPTTRGSGNGTRARNSTTAVVDYNETRPRSICDGNFLSDIVTNFLFRTSCGQRRSIVKELMFLFNLFFSWKYVFFFEQLCAFQSQFATSYFTTTTYSIGSVIPHFRVKKCSL